MLDDLTEFESADAVQAAMRARGHPAAGIVPSPFALVDYLFWGRSRRFAGVWIAGGLTVSGQSLTGSGPTAEQALWGVAGEAAEHAARAAAGLLGAAHAACGFGAHPVPGRAAAQARFEAVERRAVRRWWQGLAGGLALPPVAGGAGRPAIGVQIDAPAGFAVVLVASFDAEGREFAFGAACRGDVGQARDSALRELAQAEFGLDLVRMRAGSAGLSAADRDSLMVAGGTVRADIEARLARGPAGTEAEPDYEERRLEAEGLAVVMVRPVTGGAVAGGLAPYHLTA